MKSKLGKFLPGIILFILVVFFLICGLTGYIFSGGFSLKQDKVNVELTSIDEDVEVGWNSIATKKQLVEVTEGFTISEIVYKEDAIYLKIREDIFGSPGSELNHKVSMRVLEVNRETGNIKKVDKIPSISLTQKQNFTVDYPEWKRDISYKYEVQFYEKGQIYWDVDIRTNPEFSKIEELSKFITYVAEDYYILIPKSAEDETNIYVFNIKNRKLAWVMDIKNDRIASGQESFYVDGKDFYFITRRGGVLYVKSLD